MKKYYFKNDVKNAERALLHQALHTSGAFRRLRNLAYIKKLRAAHETYIRIILKRPPNQKPQTKKKWNKKNLLKAENAVNDILHKISKVVHF